MGRTHLSALLATLMLVSAGTASAASTSIFQCGGSEQAKTWYGGTRHIRNLSFQIEATTVNDKTFTLRFLGRSINATFAAGALSSAVDKFTLFHDKLGGSHQLTYEFDNGSRMITASCILLSVQ